MKETVKKGTIFEKEISEMIINGKDTVTVLDIDELDVYKRQIWDFGCTGQ